MRVANQVAGIAMASVSRMAGSVFIAKVSRLGLWRNDGAKHLKRGPMRGDETAFFQPRIQHRAARFENFKEICLRADPRVLRGLSGFLGAGNHFLGKRVCLPRRVLRVRVGRDGFATQSPLKCFDFFFSRDLLLLRAFDTGAID